jgi:hypothetical protein
MALFSRQSLITELLDRTELIKASTQHFLRLTDEQLLTRPAPGKWSLTELFGHLNISHDVYIRSILSRITLAPDNPSDEYNSGWLGDWVYEKVKPRADGSVFPMKAKRSHCIDLSGLDPGSGREIVTRFQHHCDALDDILRHVSTKDLRRIRVPFYLTRLVQLRLGDTLRYLVAHSERHLLQAQQVAALVI